LRRLAPLLDGNSDAGIAKILVAGINCVTITEEMADPEAQTGVSREMTPGKEECVS